MRRKNVLAVVALVRLHACLTTAALALLGAYLTGAPLPLPTSVLLAATVFFVTAGGNAMNDACDGRSDRVNRKARPIPSGAVTQRAAMAIAVACLAGGAAASLGLSAWCAVICAANVVLVIAYARWSKRLGIAKDVVVGYLVGSAVLFGAYEPARIDVPIVTLAVCAALATASRELIKDVEDKPGDLAAGARTLPIVLGDRPSYALAYLLLGLAVVLAGAPRLTGDMGAVYALVVCCGAVFFVLSWLAERPRAKQLLVMAGSVVEMAAFWVGKAQG